MNEERRARWRHTGEVPSFNTFAGTDPQNKVTIVVWVNLDPTADGRAAATLIAKRSDQRDVRVIDSDTHPLA